MVIIDIDKNTINIPETIRLQEFPIEFVKTLKSKIFEIDLHIVQTKKLSRLFDYWIKLNYNFNLKIFNQKL